MKKIVISILFLIVTSSIGWGQVLLCGTPSNRPDSAMILELEQIEQQRGTSPNIDTVYFNLQIHIIRNSNHFTSLNLDSLEKDIKELEDYFDLIAIKFHQCKEYDYIDDDDYFDFHNSDETSLISHHNRLGYINVYIANRVYINNIEYGGYSYRPTDSGARNFVIISNNCVRNMCLVHEMGHFFNLYHTHDTINGYELADGSNCSSAGDLCCDTPADPELSYNNVNSNCQYIGNATDPNGDRYDPDPHNIMSNSRHKCLDEFSTIQYIRMRNAAFLSNRTNLWMNRKILEVGNHIQAITAVSD